MNLSINFPPELEDALRLQAQAEAKTPEEFALTALLEKLNGLSPPPVALAAEDWLAEFAAFTAVAPRGNVAADVSRSAIYEGRGE